jgi:hypothetical protein
MSDNPQANINYTTKPLATNYTDKWDLPSSDPNQIFYGTDYTAIKPQRDKSDSNSDQVRRILANILPLKLLLSRDDYFFYKYGVTRGMCGNRITKNSNAHR